MLVTMATGTGKTLTMVNEIYRLMKSGVARRVLFLVDRRALAAQAVRAFASFEAEPGLKFDKIYEVYSSASSGRTSTMTAIRSDVLPNSLLTSPEARRCVRLRLHHPAHDHQSLWRRERADHRTMRAIDDDAEQLDIPIHAFDLIIADECHRGYSPRTCRSGATTLDHFDAIKIGLTATPAAHTMAYFENLAYRYDYERAVREGYLVDYDVVKVRRTCA